MFPSSADNDDSDEDEDYNSDDSDSDNDEEIILHANRRNEPLPRRRKHFQLSGSIYELYMHQTLNNLEMKIDWKSKVKYTNLWSREFLTGLESRLFTDLARAGGTIKLSKSIIGRTTLKVCVPGEEPVRYNAHPSFRSGLPWYDWVILDWGTQGHIPARLLMILETTNLSQEDILYAPAQEINADNAEVLNQTSLIKPNRIYLVVRSARRVSEPTSDRNYKFYSRLSNHITLEDNFTVVPVTCLVGPAYVVANVPYGDAEADTESVRDFIVVKDYREWSEHFINREAEETYGRPPENVEGRNNRL
jgi:hypothetical protein